MALNIILLILYCNFMRSSVLSIDDYQIEVSINSEKGLKMLFYVLHYQPRFI